MEQIVHEFKVWPRYFWAIAARAKTFEIRKNDRTGGFSVGNHLLLREYCPDQDVYTGSRILVRVDYVCGISNIMNEDVIGMSITIIENDYRVQED